MTDRIPLIIIIMSISILLPFSCSPTDHSHVSYVIDGDTIVLSGGQHIRYIGIDAPEKDEPLYKEATELNRQLVEGKIVRLEKDISDIDRYGRKLRYVYTEDFFINAEIVRSGLAVARSYPPDIKYQTQLE